MATLSVCMMVQNVEKTIAIALESLARAYDELIIVDGGSTDRTCEIVANYGARIIHSPWPDDHSQQRNVYLKEVKTDWVFVLDADEIIETRLAKFLQALQQNQIVLDQEYYCFERRWISPLSFSQYISSLPHLPDLQLRLFKLHSQLFYQGKIHECLVGRKYDPIDFNLIIYHLDLFVNSEAKRWQKVKNYIEKEWSNTLAEYYLPSLDKIQLTDWNRDSILPKVNQLIDKIA